MNLRDMPLLTGTGLHGGGGAIGIVGVIVSRFRDLGFRV